MHWLWQLLYEYTLKNNCKIELIFIANNSYTIRIKGTWFFDYFCLEPKGIGIRELNWEEIKNMKTKELI